MCRWVSAMEMGWDGRARASAEKGELELAT
jgi:hypothetical protein